MVRQPETHYAKGPNGNLAYQVVGDGPIDLVVVPGWFSHVDLLWGDPGWVTFIERTRIVRTRDSVRQARHRSVRSDRRRSDT